MPRNDLPIPSHFDPVSTGQVWRVPYQQRADAALKWARQQHLEPAAHDATRIALLLVDVQNTFCIPEFELYVAGRSGTAAVDDNRRLCEFIYRNMDIITRIYPTMDTHQAIQIFHSVFLVNDRGEHPDPFTLISVDDIDRGVWQFNSLVAESLNIDPGYGQNYLRHYACQLKAGQKYDLTIWPYHAMLGGIGHALVSAVEEAVFFHGIARYSPPSFQVKGDNAFTENYSALSPEVTEDARGKRIAGKNIDLLRTLVDYDTVIIAGQAKSHCVAWTIEDLLKSIDTPEYKLADKVYILEDCTSPVVIPDIIDYTDQADTAFQRFADAGMHLVRSTDPLAGWPGIEF
jgi:nicotinamidase-related amidase